MLREHDETDRVLPGRRQRLLGPIATAMVAILILWPIYAFFG